MARKKIKKALVLFSGGLDSLLAARLLEKNNFEVTALIFKSPFFESETAVLIAKKNGLKLREESMPPRYLQIVKKPRYGFGKNMNPCIDCHALMFKTAEKILIKEGFGLLATGEVLGQRPMSQNRQSLALVEKASGLKGRILRPLSARLLEKTVWEEQGLIDRNNLLDISGRGRKRQLELAREFQIKDYATPSGGCLLTTKEFSERLKKLFLRHPGAVWRDIELLKRGRVNWKRGSLIVIGRNQEDNTALRALFLKDQDLLLELAHYDGPVALIRNFGKRRPVFELIEKTGGQLARYYRETKNKREAEIRVGGKGKEEIIKVEVAKS